MRTPMPMPTSLIRMPTPRTTRRRRTRPRLRRREGRRRIRGPRKRRGNRGASWSRLIRTSIPIDGTWRCRRGGGADHREAKGGRGSDQKAGGRRKGGGTCVVRVKALLPARGEAKAKDDDGRGGERCWSDPAASMRGRMGENTSRITGRIRTSGRRGGATKRKTETILPGRTRKTWIGAPLPQMGARGPAATVGRGRTMRDVSTTARTTRTRRRRRNLLRARATTTPATPTAFCTLPGLPPPTVVAPPLPQTTTTTI
mmetsp:Transcript_47671/g.144141  ORF Transcript_47671/g.144141 Transcript_47671/m.144141 type:complete len:257 (+) Transcript_47671:226-996(+)